MIVYLGPIGGRCAAKNLGWWRRFGFHPFCNLFLCFGFGMGHEDLVTIGVDLGLLHATCQLQKQVTKG